MALPDCINQLCGMLLGETSIAFLGDGETDTLARGQGDHRLAATADREHVRDTEKWENLPKTSCAELAETCSISVSSQLFSGL